MDNFPILFTGKEFKGDPVEWDSFERTMARQIALQEGRQQQQAAQIGKDEAFALKTGDFDYETAISDFNLFRQAKMIDDYNTLEGQLLQKRRGQGGLTYADKSWLLSEENKINAVQEKMGKAQSLYSSDKAAIQADKYINKFDHKKFREAEREYALTGDYEYSALYPRAISFKAAMTKKGLDSGITKRRKDVDVIGGRQITKDVKRVGTRAESDERFDEIMRIEDPEGHIMSGLVEDWNDLPHEVQRVYLNDADENNDGLDEAERQNAIEEYGKDESARIWMKREEEITDKPIKPTDDKIKDYVMWDGIKIYRSPSGSLKIDEDYENVTTFSRIPPISVVVPGEKNVRVLALTEEGKYEKSKDEEGDIKTSKRLGSSQQLVPVGYVADTDEFMFRVSRDIETVWEYFKDDNIFIKRDKMSEKWNNFPILWNGKMTPVKDIDRSRFKAGSGGSFEDMREIYEDKTYGGKVWPTR